MTPHISIETPRPLPTIADIQRRRAELLGIPYQPAEQEPPSAFEQPTPPLQRDSGWPRLATAALHGIAGAVVRSIAPHTEADPAAILLQFLVAFGNLLGPAPHCMVESTRHGLNLFVVLVGESSKARKGTSWRQICRLFSEVDNLWVTRGVTTARLPRAASFMLCGMNSRPPTGASCCFPKSSPLFSTYSVARKVTSHPCFAALGTAAISSAPWTVTSLCRRPART